MADAPELSRFVLTFRLKQWGVGLSKRGPSDPHVVITLLSEDDGHWFLSGQDNKDGVSFSSFWTHELITVLEMAIDWMKKNCDPDIGSNGTSYGWIFRQAIDANP